MQYTFLIVHKILAVILSLLGVVSMEGQANAFESPSAYETAIDFGKSVDQGVFESSTEWRSAPCAADGSPATVETPFWTIAATEVVSRARYENDDSKARAVLADEMNHPTFGVAVRVYNTDAAANRTPAIVVLQGDQIIQAKTFSVTPAQAVTKYGQTLWARTMTGIFAVPLVDVTKDFIVAFGDVADESPRGVETDLKCAVFPDQMR